MRRRHMELRSVRILQREDFRPVSIDLNLRQAQEPPDAMLKVNHQLARLDVEGVLQPLTCLLRMARPPGASQTARRIEVTLRNNREFQRLDSKALRELGLLKAYGRARSQLALEQFHGGSRLNANHDPLSAPRALIQIGK